MSPKKDSCESSKLGFRALSRLGCVYTTYLLRGPGFYHLFFFYRQMPEIVTQLWLRKVIKAENILLVPTAESSYQGYNRTQQWKKKRVVGR